MAFAEDLYAHRLAEAGRATARAGMVGILITPGSDLRYLTGYDAIPLERLTCLVVPATGGEPVLVVPRLERPAAVAAIGSTGVRLVDYPDGADPYPLVANALPTGPATDPAGSGGVGQADEGADGPAEPEPDAGPGRAGRAVVGLGERMWASHVLGLRTALPDVEQRLAGPVLNPVRARKTRAEVGWLREAGGAVDAVHSAMGRWLRPGRTEAEVATDITAAMLDAGHVRADFVIVASGPNGASPHHETSDRVIQPGDPVVVDIGGTMPSGYCSDCTRTYVAGGEPPADFLAYYRVLRDAQRAAVASVAPGVPAGAVDAAARAPIAEAGYGDLFPHRTGHGIGLDTHEEPYIVAGNPLSLGSGMTFSIEPGIYLAGRHGARIEDIVVCTDDGAERLNTTSTELAYLP